MSPRTGRPTDNPKTKRIEIRLTQDDDIILEYCARILHCSKGEVLREGLSKMYALAIEKESAQKE